MGAGQSAKALQKRAVCSGGAADGKDWGAKEGQSRRKSRMWRVEVGPRWLAAPGATRVQNRRWQSPECCQRARMNRGDLFLSRYALPERGVQREWPPSLAKTVAGTKNGTVSRERRPEYNHCFPRARRLWRAGIRVRVRPHIYKDGRKVGPDQAAR